MKDYSKYFKNSEAFIEYYGTDDKVIYVKFAGSKKYQTYPLTKGNLEMFDKRMEEQYNNVIENSSLFNGSKKMFVLIAIMIITALIGLITGYVINFAPEVLNTIITFLFSLLCVEIVAVGISIINLCVNEHKLSVYKEFIQSKQKLADASKKEKNITKNIEPEQLKEQYHLKDKGLISTEFNTNFMDNMSIKELKELLTQLKIYQGLQQPVELDEEKTKKGIFTRKRVKEDK